MFISSWRPQLSLRRIVLPFDSPDGVLNFDLLFPDRIQRIEIDDGPFVTMPSGWMAGSIDLYLLIDVILEAFQKFWSSLLVGCAAFL